jgi:hypothetical protein
MAELGTLPILLRKFAEAINPGTWKEGNFDEVRQ